MPAPSPLTRSKANRRHILPPLAGAVFLALMAALYLGAIALYRAIIIGWGIEPFAYPFVDTDTVLSAVRCLRAGVDVYVANPCDPLARVYDYSPLWMALAVLPVTRGWLVPVGLGIDLGFLASLLLLPAGRRWRDAVVIAAGVVSSATLFAVERGNNDLVLFALAAGAATLATRSAGWRMVAYVLALLAGLLKYYPMTVMAVALRERPARLVAIAVASIAATALFAALTWHDLTRALALIPTGSPFGVMFGAVTIPAGLAERGVLTGGQAAALRLAMTLACLLAGGWWGTRAALEAELARLDDRERTFLLVGALLVLGCFFTAQNIGYRAVHLLLVLPPLTALAATGRWRAPSIVALALLWSEAWRAGSLALGAALGSPTFERLFWIRWLLREGLWWWLATLLVACVVALLRQAQTPRWAARVVGGNATVRPSP